MKNFANASFHPDLIKVMQHALEGRFLRSPEQFNSEMLVRYTHRERQSSRPLFRQAEHHLDGGIAAASLLELGLQPRIFTVYNRHFSAAIFSD